MTHNEQTIVLDNLACLSTEEQKQRYKSKILNKTFVFTRQKVTEYVDTSTGEIISPKLAKQLGMLEYNYGIFVKERNEILCSLRQEVKDFAAFILMFRNKRRGLSPNLRQVMHYYAKYTGKRMDNIKNRLLPQIMHKVVASDTLMMPPFQLSGKGVPAHEHLQEDFIAENTFFKLMRSKAYVVDSDVITEGTT